MHDHVLDKLRAEMRRRNLDAYIAYTAPNIFYVSGFQSAFIELGWQMMGTDMAIIPADPAQAPVLLVNEYSVDEARANSVIKDIRTYGMWIEARDIDVVMGHANDYTGQARPTRPEQYEQAEIHGLVHDILAERGLGRGMIATDLNVMKSESLEWFTRTNGSGRFVDASDMMYGLRRIKHPQEIQRLRDAAFLFERGIERVAAGVKDGQTLSEIKCNYELGVMEALARDPHLGEYQGSYVFAHIGKGSNQALRSGDVLKLDCGVKLSGYWSDCCRVFSLGEPEPLQQKVHDALASAFSVALDLMRPGVAMNQIFTAAQDEVRRHGLTNYSRGHVGHSLGLDDQIEEPPYIGRNSTLLEPGMVFSLEVPYYGRSIGGFNIEDMILITEDGHENFNTLPRTLRRL